MFSAPHPSVRTVERDAAGEFEPVYEPAGPDELERIEIVRRVHEGAMAFTRLLHERSGTAPIEITRSDAAAIIDAVIARPTRDDIRHIGRLPHALGLGVSRYETLIPETSPHSFAGLLAEYGSASAKRLYWRRGIVRAIEFEHGKGAALMARVALAATWLLAVARERARQMAGK